MMTNRRSQARTGGLHTLTFRVAADRLGYVVIYPLTEEFGTAWNSVSANVKSRTGQPRLTPSYSNLATALTAVTGQPVRLFPSSNLG